LLQLRGALHPSAENWKVDRSGKHNEDQSAGQQKFPARRHGSRPGVVGTI